MNIHDPAVLQHYLDRIERLQATATRQWGTMTPAQMLAHCAYGLEVTLGDKPAKQGLIGRIFGAMARKTALGEKPFRQNLPTDKNYIVPDQRDINTEKERLITLLRRMATGQPEVIARQVHPFFGRMTADEWSRVTCKHLDHHLRQFAS